MELQGLPAFCSLCCFSLVAGLWLVYSVVACGPLELKAAPSDFSGDPLAKSKAAAGQQQTRGERAKRDRRVD